MSDWDDAWLDEPLFGEPEEKPPLDGLYRYAVTVQAGGSSIHISPHRKCQYARRMRSSLRGFKRKREPFMEKTFPSLDEARSWWTSTEPKNYYPCAVCFEWPEHGPNPAHL